MNEKGELIEIKSDAKESEEHIVTAYAKIKIRDLVFWVLIPDWRNYFPYHPKPSKWGIGQELIKNLVGKTVELDFKLVNLEPIKKTILSSKKIIQNEWYASADNTTICGKIVGEGDIREVSEEEHRKAEDLVRRGIVKELPGIKRFKPIYVDCGIIVKMSCDADKFQIGDTIKTKGMLQASIKSIDGVSIK